MSVQTEIDRIITAVGNAYDAIGAKGGTVPADETVANLAEAVQSIPKGSAEPVLQEKSVTPRTAAQEVTPDSGYDGLSKVIVGAMPTAAQATPSITVSSSGLITASATQGAGYVADGTKSATKQLTTQPAKTITPGASNQTAVSAGRYTTGAVTVKGDANLVPGNIKSGASIFGVAGNYEGSGGGGNLPSVSTVTINCEGNDSFAFWLSPDGVFHKTSLNAGANTIIVNTYSPIGLYNTYGYNLNNLNNIVNSGGSIRDNNYYYRIYYATAITASATQPTD